MPTESGGAGGFGRSSRVTARAHSHTLVARSPTNELPLTGGGGSRVAIIAARFFIFSSSFCASYEPRRAGGSRGVRSPAPTVDPDASRAGGGGAAACTVGGAAPPAAIGSGGAGSSAAVALPACPVALCGACGSAAA
eukprot:2657346-Prymnesium_polylepis.1